jgi:3D (Asp-Asp-Asp) domain-containing protein
LPEEEAAIKNFLAIHIMTFGLIFGITCVAADDPHGYPVKSIKTEINQNQSLTAYRDEEKFTPAKLERLREVTAYNVGDPDQNYGDPCESANGEDICAALDSGSRRCAANFVPFGTLLHIASYGVCTVTDRMNRRYTGRVDIAMKKNEKQKARRFGRKRLKVTVLALQEG